MKLFSKILTTIKYNIFPQCIDIYSTFIPLYFISRFIGVAPYSLQNHLEETLFLPILRIVTITACYGIGVYYGIALSYVHQYYLMVVLRNILDLSSILVCVGSIMLGQIHKTDMKLVLNRINKIYIRLISLNSNINFQEIRRYYTKYILLGLLLIFSVYLYYGLYLIEEFSRKIIFERIAPVVGLIVSVFSTAQFAAILKTLQQISSILNNFVVKNTKNWDSRQNFLILLDGIHFEVNEICKLTNNIFEDILLLNLLVIFCSNMACGFYLVQNFSSMNVTAETYFRIIRANINVMGSYFLTRHCMSTCVEVSNKISTMNYFE